MATVKMMQGDSFYQFFDLTQDGEKLTPERVADVELCIGENLRYLYSAGGVGYDTTSQQWYFRPSQEDTLGLDPDGYDVIARVKYSNSASADVRGIKIGRLVIEDGASEEVI